MSSMDSPARARIFCVAGMTPVSISTGSEPVTAKAWNRARGRRPSRSAARALTIRVAEAASVSGEELPGVMCQPISGKRAAEGTPRKAGFSPASPATVVPGRTVSSTRWSPTGTISRSKPPPAAVAAANWWERAEKASSSWRSSFQRAAISSADTPCGTRPSG